MKAIIGQFYKDKSLALARAEANKKMWRGRVCFIVVGNEKGYMVISESSARGCGIVVPSRFRRYGRLPYKLNKLNK